MKRVGLLALSFTAAFVGLATAANAQEPPADGGADGAPQPDAAPPQPDAAAPVRTTRLQGTVRGSDGNRPLAGATVVVGNGFATTDEKGSFEIVDLPAGRYELRVLHGGYEDSTLPIEITPGVPVAVNPTLHQVFIGQELIVTGSKFPEKRVEAPVTVERLSAEDLKLSGGGTSYVNALARVKGIDYADNGVADKRVSARGFNSLFDSRLVWMVDGRLAHQPGNGLPLGGLLPTPSLDIKSVEVVIGPASALYGANAHTGVINVLTKTPWDESGIAVSMRGGTQRLTDMSLRLAGTIKRRFGYKVNAQYLQAQDFVPDRAQPSFHYGSPAAPLIFEADLVPNYDVRSAKVEGYLYLRLGRWYLKGGYGFSYNDAIAATNNGRNFLRGYQVHTQTLQLSHPNWFIHVSRTATDSGSESYAIDRLASAVQAAGGLAAVTPDALSAMKKQLAFIDNSQLIDSELQYRNEFFQRRRLRITTGLQVRAYLPSSNGTYLADGPGKPAIYAVELGGYGQADYTLVPGWLKVVGALRVDKHSDYDVQVSPKVAAVVTVAKNHNLRAGYNRAFKSPTILENYLSVNGAFLGNKTGFVVKDATGTVLTKIGALQPEQVNQVEVGYKGGIANRLFIDLDAYYSFYEHFISPLTGRANPAMGSFAFYPDGTPTAQGTPLQGALFTYSNFGAAQVVGANLGFEWWILRDRLMLSMAASYIHLVTFDTNDPSQKELLLNVPEWKGRAAITMTNLGLNHSFLRLAGRVQGAYRFASGRWNSAVFFPGGEVPARFVADLSLGYNFPHGVTVTGNVFNLTNDRGVDMLGAPPGGLTAYLDLSYRFEGLEH